MVIATQNPIEQEGTFLLPEAQKDRFLVRLGLGYPSWRDEKEMCERFQLGHPIDKLQPVTTPARIVACQQAVRAVSVNSEMCNCVLGLVRATREPGGYAPELATWIEVGASPRGAIGLDRCARAHAWLAGRDYVALDDVRAIAHDVLRHRLVMSYEANAGGVDPDRALDGLLQRVAAP